LTPEKSVAAALTMGVAAMTIGAVLSAQPQPQPKTPGSADAILSASEISVIESGGIAGRVHAVRLAAAVGKVAVEYRPREARPTAAPFAGTLEADRYVALWRDLEAARVWEAESPPPTRGADLIHVELRVRLGDSGRVVGWDEGPAQPAAIRQLAEAARRVLAAGRATAYQR
jgi:hypothetical protein